MDLTLVCRRIDRDTKRRVFVVLLCTCKAVRPLEICYQLFGDGELNQFRSRKSWCIAAACNARAMNTDSFWEIIEKSREGTAGSKSAQLENLKSLLTPLPPEEILSFTFTFIQMEAECYTWEIWAVAYIVDQGCSDDAFDYFCSGLIAQGRERFEKALLDPESIVDWCERDEVSFEGFGFTGSEIYEEKTGASFFTVFREYQKSVPASPFGYQKGGPKGVTWEEEDLPKRFPKAWAKFGD